jgi:uncharacterized membrane protein (UPF0182 family)
MRPANDMPGLRRQPGRGRVILIVAAVALFLLVTSLRQIAEFWTDFLWYQSVELESVWSRTLAARAGLGTFFVVLLFVLLWLSLLIADRISPVFHPMGPDDELLNRYHQIVDRRAGGLRILVSLVFAVITGGGMSTQWNEWLLFTNAVTVGRTDPQFNIDIGFYLFRLPFYAAVVDWLFASLVIVVLVTTVAHYLNGGIRLQSPVERVTPQVKAHLSVLLALLALVKAVDYYLQQFQVLFSTRGAVDGASFAEVNAQLPALRLLLFIAVGAFLLFIVNIWRRGWALPAVAVGLWIFVQLVIGGAYPAVFQRFVVTPEESAKETTAIERNIAATREAYGLGDVEEKDFPVSDKAADAAEAINANPTITRNVQLLDPDRVLDAFKKQQSGRAPLTFNRVATDRYPMAVPDANGNPGQTELTQVVIANREMSTNDVPSRSWQSEKLNYTHGYGFALAAGNAVGQDGAPNFAVSGVPIKNSPSIQLNDRRPDNYYFNQVPGASVVPTIPEYSVVETGSPEYDYVRGQSVPTARAEPAGGVTIDSFAKRAAFYLRFGDFDLLLSQYIQEDSRILYLRDIRQRAMAAAPFLAFDSSPYPAVVDGTTVYVLDAYTTSDRYPNSQHYPNERLEVPSLRYRSFNYVRNSVKVVIDTYNGSMKFYVVDETDPIIQAYRLAFPDLFSSKSTMSKNLSDHLRYPEDIFTVQTDMWGRYHIGDPSQFYNRDGAWEPPPRPSETPGAAVGSGANAAATPGLLIDTRSKTKLDRMAPNYVLNKLQDDPKANFMLMRSFQPYSEDESKQELTSFMVARCDGEKLGRLQVYRVDSQAETQGAAFVANQMSVDKTVSEKVTLLGQEGTKVLFSDLILLPIDRTVVYVRSMYVVANDTPLVQYVVLSWGQKVYIETTLKAALRRAFEGSNPQTWEADRVEDGSPAPPAVPPGNPAPPGTGPPGTAPDGDVQSMLADATKLYDDATAALKAGDLVGYAQKQKEAEEKVRAASGLAPAPTTTTTTTAPPAPGTTAAPAPPPP